MNPLTILLRIGGILNLAVGFGVGLWYWNSFNNTLVANLLGGPTSFDEVRPLVLVVAILCCVEGVITCALFMAVAQILDTCRDNQGRIIRLGWRQHELRQAVEKIGASA